MDRYNMDIKQENEFDISEFKNGIIITGNVSAIHGLSGHHIQIQQQPQHHQFLIQHPQIIIHEQRLPQNTSHFQYIQQEESNENISIQYASTPPPQSVSSDIPNEIHITSNLMQPITKLEIQPIEKFELNQHIITKLECPNTPPLIVSASISSEADPSVDNEKFDPSSQQYQDNININIVCKVCKENFVGVEYFTEHMKTHSPSEKKEIEIVGATKIEMVDLSETLNTDKSAYPCAFCNKKYIWHKFLVTHSKLHNVPAPFVCTICGDSFDCLYYDHMKTHILQEGRTCSKCNENFVSLRALKVHVKTHHNPQTNVELKHKCNICGKFYKALSYLREHERIHTGEKPYTCDICGKGFAKYGCFAEHKKTHSIVKAFKCPMCTKAFTKRRYLKAHLLRHPKTLDLDKIFVESNEGEMPGRRFLFGPNKNKPVKKVPPKLECPICYKEFKKMRYLRSHISRHPDSFIRQKLGIKPDMPIPALISSGSFNADRLTQNNKNSLINFASRVIRKDLSSDESSTDDDDGRNEEDDDVENDVDDGIGPDGREKGEIDDEGNFDIQRLDDYSDDESHKNDILNPLSSQSPVKIEEKVNNFYCTICHKNFIELNLLKEHELVHYGEKPFRCMYCKITFVLEARYNEHMKKKHKCENDDTKNEDDQLNLNRYFNTEEKTFTCRTCAETFLTENMLEEHEEIHIGEEPIKCTQCEEIFAVQTAFIEHEKSHQEPIEGRVLRSTRSKKKVPSVKLRLKRSRIKKTKTSGIRRTSQINSKIKLTTDEKKRYKCNICGKLYTTIFYLREHLLIHSGKRPHKCEKCDKTFAAISCYREHMELHANKKNHKCNVCGISFAVARYLKAHMRRHQMKTRPDGGKRFDCEKCEKRYQSKTALNEHMKIHTGEAPFTCAYCGKVFMLTSSFRDHMLKHENVEFHQCPFCPKNFVKARYLQQHLVRHIQKLDTENIISDDLTEEKYDIHKVTNETTANLDIDNSQNYIPSADGQSLVYANDLNNSN